MFRSAGVLRNLPTIGGLEAHKRVNRLLGGNYEVFASIGTYSQLLTEAKSDAVATAARLGRAEGYIARGALTAALEDVNAVIKNPSPAAPELTQLAAAMRLRINNALLDAAEEVMIGSDGSNASQVSDLRGVIANDLEYLISKRGDCQLTSIVKAEFLIAQGKYADAIPLLDGAINRCSSIAPDYSNESAPVTPTAENAAEIIAYQKSHASAPSKDVVALLKGKLGVAKDEDAVALAAVYAAAGADHVYTDFFGPTDRYALWRSDAAQAVRKALGHYGGVSASIDNAVNHYAPERPATVADVDAILKSSKPVLESVSTLPKSNDASLKAVLDELIASCKQYQAEGPKTAADWSKFNAQLREQMVARCKANKAVCLAETKKEAEAIALLDEVIAEDKYLHMWKAFLARGRANKSSGLVDAAESDLKKLFELKLTHYNHDVPLKDEYRTKSVF